MKMKKHTNFVSFNTQIANNSNFSIFKIFDIFENIRYLNIETYYIIKKTILSKRIANNIDDNFINFLIDSVTWGKLQDLIRNLKK